MIIGYARVSTEAQRTDAQIDQLTTSGCARIYQETISGSKRQRPQLDRMLNALSAGDLVVVTKFDRLGRSLKDLLEIVASIRDRGADFRSLAEDINTATPSGRLQFHVFGALAEFERDRISERTREGIAAARRRGSLPGNPALRSGDPVALEELRVRRENAYFDKINATASVWLPVVRANRPSLAWDAVLSKVNAAFAANTPPSSPWTLTRLVRAVKRFARDGLIDEAVLRPAVPRPSKPLLETIAGMKRSNPDMALKDMARELEAMRIPTPRGHLIWSTGSVNQLVRRARASGLLG